jgi:hypothetical protein
MGILQDIHSKGKKGFDELRKQGLSPGEIVDLVGSNLLSFNPAEQIRGAVDQGLERLKDIEEGIKDPVDRAKEIEAALIANPIDIESIIGEVPDITGRGGGTAKKPTDVIEELSGAQEETATDTLVEENLEEFEQSAEAINQARLGAFLQADEALGRRKSILTGGRGLTTPVSIRKRTLIGR